MVEVEITHPAVNKLDVFSDLGVPEVWLSRPDSVRILQLVSGRYVDPSSSLAFPFLTVDKLSDLLRQGRSVRRSEWIRGLRDWLKDVRPKGD